MKSTMRCSTWMIVIAVCVAAAFILAIGDSTRPVHAADRADIESDRDEPTEDADPEFEDFDEADDDFDDADRFEPDEPNEDDEFEEWDEGQNRDERDEEEDFELILGEVELQQAEMQHVTKTAEIAGDRLMTAALAIERVGLLFEVDEAVAFLEQQLQSVKDDGIRRLIRLKLAELYAEFDDANRLREQLRLLIHAE